MEKESGIKQLVDMETVVGFCIQAGKALEFGRILAKAAGLVLEENASHIYSLLDGVSNHLPNDISEKEEIRKLRKVASSVGVVVVHDTEWTRSVLVDVGGASDGSWTLLPFLFAAIITSNIWSVAAYDVDNGGFNNNIHCLARCINTVIAGCEFVRLDREIQSRNSMEIGAVSNAAEHEAQSRLSAEVNIKSTMQSFVSCSAGIVLDSWNESNRPRLISKLIFMDQLCELSSYLPRSTLELHIPYSILRSLYCQYHGNFPSTALAFLSPSPWQSPAVSLTHTPSPLLRNNRGDMTFNSGSYASGYFKNSSNSQEHAYEVDSGVLRIGESKQRNDRRSGPLDYSTSRRVKFVEGSNSGSTGPSPLPRFAVSRSGPLLYK